MALGGIGWGAAGPRQRDCARRSRACAPGLPPATVKSPTEMSETNGGGAAIRLACPDPRRVADGLCYPW